MTITRRMNLTVCKLGWQRHPWSLTIYTPSTVWTISGLSLGKAWR